MRRLVPLLAVLALAGCGGGGSHQAAPTTPTAPAPTAPETGPSPETQSGATTVPPPATTRLRVYFLRDGKVAPVAREVPRTQAVARAAVAALLAGPTSADGTLGSHLPEGTSLRGLAVADGVARVRLSQRLSREAQAELVYTLTQFPSVSSVSLDGSAPLTRADFEDETPQILVETPLPHDAVASPLRVAGTANTFEATFQAEVLDSAGKRLASKTVTATSGTGQRGTYEVAIPLDAPAGPISLVVYEASAADGTHLHQVEIPLALR